MSSLTGDSSELEVSGVHGINVAGGIGVLGDSSKADGVGVFGQSNEGVGVKGLSHGQFRNAVVGVNDFSAAGPGAGGNGGFFESAQGEGVRGTARNPHHGGVVGKNSAGGNAVFGESLQVGGAGAGVFGISTSGKGIEGHSTTQVGVFGQSDSNAGVLGDSKAGRGVHGISQTREGVLGQTNSPGAAAVAAINHAVDGTGAAVFAEKRGEKGHAGFFAGHVHVTKNLTVDGDIVLTNVADCAEDFDIATGDAGEPGTVMVLGEQGALFASESAYDRRVVGVISGAGDYKPGIVLDRQHHGRDRKPIALMGKVFCKVDASSAPVSIGDLLTTSNMPGHAMKAVDPTAAFGAVIGKALRPLKEGQGLIPILVTLQ